VFERVSNLDKTSSKQKPVKRNLDLIALVIIVATTVYLALIHAGSGIVSAGLVCFVSAFVGTRYSLFKLRGTPRR
jgi:hypothetical protein